jgi:hypothetical protein
VVDDATAAFSYNLARMKCMQILLLITFYILILSPHLSLNERVDETDMLALVIRLS